jgi:small membrane protein
VQILIQVVIVIAVILASLALMRGGTNARHLAIRRIVLALFAVSAASSVIFPEILTSIAHFFGIGRGTDLVLYATVVVFFIYMATAFQRSRQTEVMITKLARRIALDEVPKPQDAAGGPRP